MVTHLHADCTVDAMAILERQEKAVNKLKNMKHEYGSLQTWLQRFDDAIDECKSLGATLTDDMQRTYLMHNLNGKIFEQTLLLWRGVLTRTTFPQTYDSLKAYITNEYSSQMTQTECTKVIYGVISAHQKKKTELSLKTNETDKHDKDKCFICDRKGHKMKKCWYYDATKTVEQNKKEAAKKIKAKLEAKKKRRKHQTRIWMEQRVVTTIQIQRIKTHHHKKVPMLSCHPRQNKQECARFTKPVCIANHVTQPGCAQGKWISYMILAQSVE